MKCTFQEAQDEVKEKFRQNGKTYSFAVRRQPRHQQEGVRPEQPTAGNQDEFEEPPLQRSTGQATFTVAAEVHAPQSQHVGHPPTKSSEISTAEDVKSPLEVTQDDIRSEPDLVTMVASGAIDIISNTSKENDQNCENSMSVETASPDTTIEAKRKRKSESSPKNDSKREKITQERENLSKGKDQKDELNTQSKVEKTTSEDKNESKSDREKEKKKSSKENDANKKEHGKRKEGVVEREEIKRKEEVKKKTGSSNETSPISVIVGGANKPRATNNIPRDRNRGDKPPSKWK